jgi:hypothetical protein
MDQSFNKLMIDFEEDDNCGYFPIQVFETQSEPQTAALITIQIKASEKTPNHKRLLDGAQITAECLVK